MSKRPKLEELNVRDDFLLNAIANDPDVGEPFFREVLSILLEREIGEIQVKAQSVIPGDSPELRGIRLDVEIYEADDSPAKCRIYNMESQSYREESLQKRSRYYQAKKDSKGLKTGEKRWSKLPDLYMIMITTFDPFGKDSMVYTFKNTCEEFPDLAYGDGLKFIYFNIIGKKHAAQAKKELLTYLNHSRIESVTSNQVAHIHDYVRHVKQSAEVRERYMTIGEMMDMSKEEGRSEGRAEGRAEGQRLGRKNLILGVLSELGPVPKELQARLDTEDEETLIRWNKLAARAESMEEFLNQI